MSLDYEQYKREVSADIASVLAGAGCQPILFVGSGFTRRYAGGPSWEELLSRLAADCPLIDKEFAYFKQAYAGDMKKIGTVFSDLYREWAWGDGRNGFPKEYFSESYPSAVVSQRYLANVS